MTELCKLPEAAHDDVAFESTMFLMPCEAADEYMFERIARNSYCLTVAAPGFEAEDIEVAAHGGFLRITGSSTFTRATGEILHCGLDSTLDRSFMLLQPLEVTGVEVRRGLLRIYLQSPTGTGLRTLVPPRLSATEALALAA